MASREEMKKEAVERMEILGIKKDFIKLFADNDGIRMTLQILTELDPRTRDNNKIIEDDKDSSVSFGGTKYLITSLFPSQERFELIRKLEEDRNCVVYFGCRVGLTPNADEDVDAYFFVGEYKDEWQSERKFAERGLAYAHTTVPFFPKNDVAHYETQELQTVTCCDGNLAVWV